MEKGRGSGQGQQAKSQVESFDDSDGDSDHNDFDDDDDDDADSHEEVPKSFEKSVLSSSPASPKRPISHRSLDAGSSSGDVGERRNKTFSALHVTLIQYAQAEDEKRFHLIFPVSSLTDAMKHALNESSNVSITLVKKSLGLVGATSFPSPSGTNLLLLLPSAILYSVTHFM